MVSCDVPPVIQFFEVGQPSVVRRIMGRHVEREAEPIEVFPDHFNVRIPAVERPVRGSLPLHENSQACPDPESDDQGAFCIEIPAVALKMSGEQQDEATEIFIDESDVRVRQGVGSRALSIDLVEPGCPVARPKPERSGGHSRS